MSLICFKKVIGSDPDSALDYVLIMASGCDQSDELSVLDSDNGCYVCPQDILKLNRPLLANIF